MAYFPPDTTLESITVQRLTVRIASPYASVLERFRALVPPIALSDLRQQTEPEGFSRVIHNTGTTTGFVLFSEFNHGHWIRYFPPFSLAESADPASHIPQPGRGMHRFIFGNPLFAITMIRENIEAALHVPLDCGFVEQKDGSTVMIMILPKGLVAGHAVSDNQQLHEAAQSLEDKVSKLIEAITTF